MHRTKLLLVLWKQLQLLDKNDEVILVGLQDIIEARLSSFEHRHDRISVVHAPDVIGMDETPIESLRRKPKSSIGVFAKLAKMDQADAVISAGNTGACVVAFQMRMRNLPGVNRPGHSSGVSHVRGAGNDMRCRREYRLQADKSLSIWSDGQRIFKTLTGN